MSGNNPCARYPTWFLAEVGGKILNVDGIAPKDNNKEKPLRLYLCIGMPLWAPTGNQQANRTLARFVVRGVTSAKQVA